MFSFNRVPKFLKFQIQPVLLNNGLFISGFFLFSSKSTLTFSFKGLFISMGSLFLAETKWIRPVIVPKSRVLGLAWTWIWVGWNSGFLGFLNSRNWTEIWKLFRFSIPEFNLSMRNWGPPGVCLYFLCNHSNIFGKSEWGSILNHNTRIISKSILFESNPDPQLSSIFYWCWGLRSFSLMRSNEYGIHVVHS